MNECWVEFTKFAHNLCTAHKKNDDKLKTTIKDIVKKIIEADSSLTTGLLEKLAVEIYVDQLVIANRFSLIYNI
jgi:hypothetical protein